MHTPQHRGNECPSSRASSSCGERYALLTEELYGEDYRDLQAPSFLGATEHAHAVDTRPSFLCKAWGRGLYALCQSTFEGCFQLSIYPLTSFQYIWWFSFNAKLMMILTILYCSLMLFDPRRPVYPIYIAGQTLEYTTSHPILISHTNWVFGYINCCFHRVYYSHEPKYCHNLEKLLYIWQHHYQVTLLYCLPLLLCAFFLCQSILRVVILSSTSVDKALDTCTSLLASLLSWIHNINVVTSPAACLSQAL